MKEWLSPDGIMAAAMLVLLLISIAKNIAQALGKKELVAALEGAEGKAATFQRVAGSLVKGVERVKREGKVDPKAVTQLVETLREENLLAQVEDVVKPIITEARVAPEAPAAVVVAKATARLDPQAVLRRVS